MKVFFTRQYVLIRAGWLAGVLLLLALRSALAQNVCQGPGATTNGFALSGNGRTCIGEPIRITNVAPGLSNPTYVYQYNGQGVPTNPTTATESSYVQPGTYTIVQIANGGSSISCKTVEVLPTPFVSVESQICTAGIVSLSFTFDDQTRRFDRVEIDWGDGQIERPTPADLSQPKAHQYTGNRSPVIQIRGLYDGLTCTGSPLSIPIGSLNTENSIQPLITLLVSKTDQTLAITYQTDPGREVQLFQQGAGGAFISTGQTATGSGTFTVAALPQQSQCFRVGAANSCGSSVQSPVVCSLVPIGEASEKQNTLTWSPLPTPPVRLRVQRDTRPATGLPPTQTDYVDRDGIVCNARYCYVLEADLSDKTTIRSAPVCLRGLSSDPPQLLTSALASTDGQPVVSVQLPDGTTAEQARLAISRGDTPAGPFVPIGEVQDTTTFRDAAANANAQSYCYRVVYKNGCGLQTDPSLPVCTIWLTVANDTELRWTAAPSFLSLLESYTLLITDTRTGQTRTVDVGGSTQYSFDIEDPSITFSRFQVRATSAGGLQSVSNVLEFDLNPRVQVPTAFTPNSDGVNDLFLLKGLFWVAFDLKIYNRWGAVIFQTSDVRQGWDGTIGGLPALGGAYNYRLDVQGIGTRRVLKTGQVLLIR